MLIFGYALKMKMVIFGRCVEAQNGVFGRCVEAHQGVVLDLVEGGVLRVHLVLGQLCLQESSWFTHRKQTKYHLVIKYHVENYGHAHTNVD